MSTLVVGNWKMHLGPKEGVGLVKKLQDRILPKRGVEVVLCPPFLDLVPIKDVLDRQKFRLGAQNCHYLDDGAVTGEISASMLRGLATYVIVGHSERRTQFAEDDKLIARKLAAAVRNNLRPILCVGENLHQRQSKLSVKVVVDQLTANLALLTASDVDNLVVAYEPVWAIGTGEFATPAQIEPVIRAIRRTVEDLYGEGGASGLQVIYGGSVTADNCGSYLAEEGIEGFLVGGASLNPEQFAKIVEVTQNPPKSS
jgi:triosephosphate isomerase